MHCKLCGKTVHSISHWAREHGAYLRRKAASAPRRPRRTGAKASRSPPERSGGLRFCPHCGGRL